MGEIDIIAVSPIFLSLIGIILDILSPKRSENLIRNKEICESVIIELIEHQLNEISVHYKNEIDRIFELIISGSGRSDIKVMNVRKNILNVKPSELHSILLANKLVNKLDRAYLRIKIFRWVFFFLFGFALIELFVLIMWPNIIQFYIPIIVCSISFIFLISLIYELMNSSNLIDTVRKEYGISI